MLYLLYGEFETEIDKFINKLMIDNNIDTKLTYNYKDTTINDVIEECSYLDLFGNNKIVVLNECFFLTGKETLDSELLTKYIDNPNQGVILIFKVITDKLDERKKLVKLLKSKSIVKEFKLLDSRNINNYISEYFKSKGYKIDYDSINEIKNRLVDNTKVIDTELDKLYLYKINDKVITINDVKKVICKYDDNVSFKLVNSVLKKDKKSIFNLYKELINKNEEPIMILTMLANQFRLIYEVKVLSDSGLSLNDIASKLKEHPYRVQITYENSLNIGKKEIKRIITKLYETDYNIKTGIMDKEKALELFFLEL